MLRIMKQHRYVIGSIVLFVFLQLSSGCDVFEDPARSQDEFEADVRNSKPVILELETQMLTDENPEIVLEIDDLAEAPQNPIQGARLILSCDPLDDQPINVICEPNVMRISKISDAVNNGQVVSSLDASISTEFNDISEETISRDAQDTPVSSLSTLDDKHTDSNAFDFNANVQSSIDTKILEFMQPIEIPFTVNYVVDSESGTSATGVVEVSITDSGELKICFLEVGSMGEDICYPSTMLEPDQVNEPILVNWEGENIDYTVENTGDEPIRIWSASVDDDWVFLSEELGTNLAANEMVPGGPFTLTVAPNNGQERRAMVSFPGFFK